MFKKIIDKLAGFPSVFIFLRKVLENNFRTQKRVIVERLSFNPESPVLDIGCGTGEFSVFFNPAVYVGIDIEKDYIDFAKKKYGGKFLLGDATALSFPDDSFSKILVVGVLHHLDDQTSRTVLAEADRVLSPGGRMLILEDVDSPANGRLTNLIHRLDKGKFIRKHNEYGRLLEERFKAIESFRLRSGLGAYQVFLLAKKNE